MKRGRASLPPHKDRGIENTEALLRTSRDNSFTSVRYPTPGPCRASRPVGSGIFSTGWPLQPMCCPARPKPDLWCSSELTPNLHTHDMRTRLYVDYMCVWIDACVTQISATEAYLAVEKGKKENMAAQRRQPCVRGDMKPMPCGQGNPRPLQEPGGGEAQAWNQVGPLLT